MKKMLGLISIVFCAGACSVAANLDGGSYTVAANRDIFFGFSTPRKFAAGASISISGDQFQISDGAHTVSAVKDGTTTAFNAVHENSGMLAITYPAGSITTNITIETAPNGLNTSVYTNITYTTNSAVTNNGRKELGKISQIYKAKEGGVTLYFAVLSDEKKLYVSPVSSFRRGLEAPTYYTALVTPGGYGGAFPLQDVTMYYFADKN